MWSVLLMGLGGLLIGGAISFHQQKKARWVPISFIVLAVMSLVAAYLMTLPGVNQPAMDLGAPAVPVNHAPSVSASSATHTL
ncbi:MAG TPA: hypothetical protein VGN49_11175 [Micrococcaceae bacterium]|jgi:hypothetical protein|nr:hypothetical protein [Micrococcaceae bacterium]